MELYLQFGYGMMEHCRHLLTRWGGGTAILSPRDLDSAQLVRLASDITGLPNGKVLLDPQFYLPHSDHERLCAHEFWPKNYETGTFWEGQGLSTLLQKLQALNRQISSSAFILPGLLADRVDDDWLEIQRATLEDARRLEGDLPLFMTLALSDDAGRSQDQIAMLLERSEDWAPEGFYVVCEHPSGQYLVDNADWLANVADLVAGLRLRGAKVVLGYCNHQMLIAASAHATAICSGTWMNVRSFPPEKFRVAYDEEIKQRATWYYSPQALSEYKLPFLDIARRQNILDAVAPPADLDGGYVANLFRGAQPTTVDFTEQAAFRHYLHALRAQTLASQKASFDDTTAAHERLLDDAERLLAQLSVAGVRGQLRDFREIVDVNRAALAVLGSTRGALLRRKWSAM
jgi:PAS domain-containing protein